MNKIIWCIATVLLGGFVGRFLMRSLDLGIETYFLIGFLILIGIGYIVKLK